MGMAMKAAPIGLALLAGLCAGAYAQVVVNGMTCAQFSANPACVQAAQQQAVQGALAAQQAAPQAPAAPGAVANAAAKQNLVPVSLDAPSVPSETGAAQQAAAPASFGQTTKQTSGKPRLQQAQGKPFSPVTDAADSAAEQRPEPAKPKPGTKMGINSRFGSLTPWNAGPRKTLQPFTPLSDIQSGAAVNSSQITGAGAGSGAASGEASGAQSGGKPKTRGGPIYGHIRK